MSERYGHSKGKICKPYKKDEASKSKKREATHKCDDAEPSRTEPKTPPLPPRRTSIDELIKKRDSLKEELKKIVKHSDSDLPSNFSTKYVNNQKHSKNNYPTVIKSRKRSNLDKVPSNSSKKKNTVKDFSPGHTGDYAQVESEDEETIIERSRQRRKQLLKTLNTPQDNIPEEEYNPTEKSVDTKEEAPFKTNISVIKQHKQATDMFSEVDDFINQSQEKVLQDNIDENHSQLTDNWDDAEGYYNVTIGDEIDKGRYIIKSILGQGVFSNVVRARDSNGNTDVAIKIIRNNDVTHRTGLKEINILKEIREADHENKYHCVRIIRHFMHKNHLCMVMESLHMDMRHIIKRYGHHHGLNMKAIISYSRQLLVALRLLKKLGIVHADIKPDNILVNDKKNVLKLCDFGSASKVDTNEATPYLVSRFYRAPEIILGVTPYKHNVDIWSAACTIYEMATGKIMFTGGSNNKMLKSFMDLKGKFSAKLIRRGKFKDQHFNYKNNFLLHKKDEHTGRDKCVEIIHIPATRDLLRDLNKYCKTSTENEVKKIMLLKDMLDKMLVLDLKHRYSVTDCLKHAFIREEFTE